MKRQSFLAVVLFLLAGLTCVAARGTTREEIIENRSRRKGQLERSLAEAKETMEDHTSGRRLLDEKEFDSLERKINAFERKLESMSGEMEEREVDKVLKREKLRFERDAARREERRQRGSSEL